MGTQIELAYDRTDENALSDFLNGKWKMYCLPRFFSESEPDVLEFGASSLAVLPENVIIFPEELVDENLRRVAPVLEGPGLFHFYPKAGACIEWTRSELMAGDRIVPDRFYLDTKPLGEGLPLFVTEHAG